jgi:hypothetical protein
MSFHKRHIPEIKDLMRIYEECADDKTFLDKVIGKADAVTGSLESMDFIEKIEEKVYPKKKTWEDLAKINKDPEKWLDMYQHYQELLTREDVAGWWEDQYYMCNNERQNLKGGDSAKDWLEVFVKWQKAQVSHTIDGLQEFLETRCYPPAYRKNGEI